MTFEEKLKIVQRLFNAQDESKFKERIESELDLITKVIYETKDSRVNVTAYFPFIEKEESFLLYLQNFETWDFEALKATIIMGLMPKLLKIQNKYGGSKKMPNFVFKLGYSEQGLIFSFFYCSNDYEEQIIMNMIKEKESEV